MKSLRASRPVLWFLFLFNLAVALAAGAAGNHIHIYGHTIHGAQIAAGMGVVALGAGIGLLRRRAQQPVPDYRTARIPGRGPVPGKGGDDLAGVGAEGGRRGVGAPVAGGRVGAFSGERAALPQCLSPGRLILRLGQQVADHPLEQRGQLM
jgi:hypothetical protein